MLQQEFLPSCESQDMLAKVIESYLLSNVSVSTKARDIYLFHLFMCFL